MSLISVNNLTFGYDGSLKNIFENIEIVYQLYSFRCIINLSYEVTPLFIYCRKFIIH